MNEGQDPLIGSLLWLLIHLTLLSFADYDDI